MKLGMTSKLELRLRHANDGVVYLFLGPLLPPSHTAIYLVHRHDLSTGGFATLNTPQIYALRLVVLLIIPCYVRSLTIFSYCIYKSSILLSTTRNIMCSLARLSLNTARR